MIPVTVAVKRGEHDAERTGPLTEEDEEVVPQALLWKQEAPVVHWGGRRESLLYIRSLRRSEESANKNIQDS